MRAWGFSPAVDTKEKRSTASRSRSSSQRVKSHASKSRDKEIANVTASDSTPQARRKHRSNSRWRRGKESKPIDELGSTLKKEDVETSSTVKKETKLDKSGNSDKSEQEAGSHSERENSQSKTKKSRKHKLKCKGSEKEDNADASTAKESNTNVAESLAKKSRKKDMVPDKKDDKGDEESNEVKVGAHGENSMDTPKAPPENEAQNPRKSAPKIVLLGRTAKKMKRGFKKASTQVVEDPEKSLDQDDREKSKVGLANKEAPKIKAGLRQARSKMMSKPARQAKSKMMSKPLLRKENSRAKKDDSDSESVSESVESSESSEVKHKRKSKKKKRTKKKKAKKKRGKNDSRKVRSEPPQVVTHMPTFVAVPSNFAHPGLMPVRPLPGSVQMLPMQGSAAAFAKFGGMQPLGQNQHAESSNKLSSSELRALIKGIYERHNPAKLADFGSLMQKYEGFENDVYLYVCKKYGEEPEPGTVDVESANIALAKPKAKTMAVAKKASAFAPLKPRAKASSADSHDTQELRDSREEDSTGWPFVGEDYSDGGSSSSSSAPMRSEISQSSAAKEPVVEQLRLPSGARMPLCKGHLMRGIGQGWPSIVHSASRYTRDAERYQGEVNRKQNVSDDASKTLSDFLASCNSAPTVNAASNAPTGSAASSTDEGAALKSIARTVDSQAEGPHPVVPEWQDSFTQDDALHKSENHESKESPKTLELSNEVRRQDLEEAVISLAELPPEDDVMQHEGSTTEESRSPSPCRRSGTMELGVNLQADEASDPSCVCMESASENVCKAIAVDASRNSDSFANNTEAIDPLDKAAETSFVDVAKGAEETLPSHASLASSSENKLVNSIVESETEARTATSLDAKDSAKSHMNAETSEMSATSSRLQSLQIVAPAPTMPPQSLVLPATEAESLQSPQSVAPAPTIPPQTMPEKEKISVTSEAISTAPVQAPYEATPLANGTPVATLVPEAAQDASEKVLTKSLLDALDAAERLDPQLKPTTLPMGSGSKSAPTPAQQAALSRLMHLTSLSKSQTKAVATSKQPVETPVSAGTAEQVQNIQQVSASTSSSQVAASARVADLPVPPPPPGPPPADIPQAPLVTSLGSLGWAGVPLHWAQMPFSAAQLFPAAMVPAAPPPPPPPT